MSIDSKHNCLKDRLVLDRRRCWLLKNKRPIAANYEGINTISSIFPIKMLMTIMKFIF